MGVAKKKTSDLTDDEKLILERLFQHSPTLKDAVSFRDELTDIFNNEELNVKRAKLLLNGWSARVQRSGIKCFDGFIKTLNLHKEAISNYFNGRYNSGFVEGINNKIKVIKRRCYGLINRAHLYQRLYLDLWGHVLYGRKIKELPSMNPEMMAPTALE